MKATMGEAVGMHCPGCGQPPVMAFATQAFCGTDDCKVITWNPTLTMDELLDNAQHIDLPTDEPRS